MDCLVVENDAFGFIPACVYRRDDTFAVSTSIETLISAGATVTLSERDCAEAMRTSQRGGLTNVTSFIYIETNVTGINTGDGRAVPG